MYTVFTIDSVNKRFIFNTFKDFEKAKKYVDDTTQSNIFLVGGDAVIYDTFGKTINALTNYKPEFINCLFPFDIVEYGTTVRETINFGNDKGAYCYTYRFVIESVLE